MKALKLNKQMVVLAVAILVVCLLLFDKCNSKPEQVTYNDTDSLKQVIASQTRVKDSLLIAVKKKDTLRVEIIKKYKVLKHDTIYANICAPIIKLCDSIILVDSSLITDLKNVIKVDSVIITNYKKVAEVDSNTIVGLNKDIAKHKRHKRWLVGGIITTGVIAILK
jgi:hypothetical protein